MVRKQSKKMIGSLMMLAVSAITGHAAWAGSPLSFTGATYTQNFAGFTTATGTPAAVTYFADSGATSADGWQYYYNAGVFTTANSTSGGIHIAPTTVSGDPDTTLLGSLGSGTATTITYGIVLTNNSGGTINTLNLAFNDEIWRTGTSTNELGTFSYAVGASSIATTNLATLDSAFNLLAPSGSLVSYTPVSGQLTNLAWTPGTTLVLQWTDSNSAGTDYGIGIDDVQISATGIVSNILYWTADGATLGGAGTWDAVSNNWSSSNTSISGGVWNSSMIADFAGTAGTINIASGGITANAGLTFDVDGYVINGAGILTLGGTTPAITVTNAATTATINAQIAGSAGLTVQGAGTLILTNTSNNFTGTVTISGILSIADDRVLGDTGNAVTLTGGTLQTTASINTARNFSGAGTLNIAPTTTLAVTNPFNTTALTLSNTGTLDLQGSATVGALKFTGPGGTLTSTTNQPFNATTLDATTLTGTATISSPGGLNLPGIATITVQVGPSTGTPAGDLNIQAPISLGGSGNTSLHKTGTGTLELNAVNSNLWRVQIGSASATSPIIGGTVIINNNQALGNNQFFLNNGTLQASTDLTSATGNAIPIGVSISGLDNGPAVFSGSNIEFQGSSDLYPNATVPSHVTVNNTTTLSGAFSSGGSTTPFNIDGPGKLVFSGDASLMTTTTNVGGTATLQIDNNITTNWPGAINVNSAARLQGMGTITGSVAVNSGGTIAPGSSSTTLTITQNLTLASGSISQFVIDAPASPSLGISSNIAGIAALTYGGNLQILLGTGTLATGDSWKLFSFSGQTGGFDNNAVFGTNGSASAGLLPDLSVLDAGDSNAKWFFNYVTGTLSIADSGGTNTPPTLLWTGGNATWDQATPRWQNTSPNDTVWNNTTNGPATVAKFASSNTIAIAAAGVAANGLNFQAASNGIVLNGSGALTLNGPIVFVDPAATATIAAKISGSAGINLLGGGILVLSSTASDFTGNVSVSAGTLSISDDRNLGSPANPIALTGATLKTTAAINTARNISGTGTLDIAPATTYATTGSFNTTSLTLSDTGTLDLQGSAPSVGTLTLTTASTLTSSTGQQIAATGIVATNLNGTATISSTGGLNLGSTAITLNVGTSGTLIVQAPITGGKLTKSGAGLLELNGNNSAMANVQIGSGTGTVQINNNNALGSGQLFFNGGTLSATTDLTSTTGNALPIGVSIGSASTTGSTTAVFTGQNMEFTGAVGLYEYSNEYIHILLQNTTIFSGAFTSDTPNYAGLGFIVDGGGTLVINGNASAMLRNTIVNGATSLIVNNTFGGTVTLNSGSLGGSGTVAAAVIPGTAPHTIAPGATLAPNAATTLTVASLTTNGSSTLLFNLVAPESVSNPNGVSDSLIVTTPAGLTLGSGTTINVNVNHSGGPSSASNAGTLGYYKVIGYSTSFGGTFSSLTLPASEQSGNVVYTLDTTHDAGFIDIHRGYLGDVDDSGFVDINDLAILAIHWQQAGGWSQGNFLGDPVVDINDLSVLATHWQTGIAAFGQAADSLPGTSQSFQDAVAGIVFGGASQVPEPTSLALLALGAAGLIARRRPRTRRNP